AAQSGPRLGAGQPNARLGAAGIAVALAGVAVNGLAYLAPLLGARYLTAAELSTLATALALAAIASVPGLGLQTALAVRWARDGAVANAGRATVVTAATVAGILLAAIPLWSAALRLPVELPLIIAATTVAVVGASRWLGELQGGQQFGRLALGMVLLALARYGGVIAGLVAGAGVTASLLLGTVVAWACLPVLAGLSRGRAGRPHPPEASERAGARLTRAEIGAASGATLAMLVVSYADLILARNLLTLAESGAYAVGAVLTRGALWAPQVVTVLARPRLAKGSRGALVVSLALVAACGTVLVVASWFGGGLAMSLAGGPGYTHLGRFAAGFAAIGALYALVFVLVNAEIAANVRWPGALLWLGPICLLIGAALVRPDRLDGLLALSLAVTSAVALAMGARALVRHRRSVRRAEGPASGEPA
ncbi:MAG TPA: polysaccharide biosynthesis protein, partial [Micromonosporaceae bacterium]